MRKQHNRSEFELIAAKFAPLAKRERGALGLTDDAAILDFTARKDIVVTADMATEGVHFLADDPPQSVGRKTLRFNLSDLASMGARPLYYLLSLALPADRTGSWLDALTEGLAQDQDQFGVVLIGGDTTATAGPACLSITAIGEAGRDGAIKRSGARAGDKLFVSGTIGDAATGLRALRGDVPGLRKDDRSWLVDRYRLPEPRLKLGERLNAVATAGIDVSDGLVADVAHIAEASNVGILLDTSRMPLSAPTKRCLEAGAVSLSELLSGGDDYELAFTAPAAKEPEIRAISDDVGVPITGLGDVETGQGLRILGADGQSITVERPGFEHF